LREEGDDLKSLIAELRTSVLLTLFLAVLCCAAYPVVVRAFARVLFPAEAGGSLIRVGGNVAGSSLLAQGFAGGAYFHPRPSAAGQGYDAAGSSGTNLGPTSKKLIDDVRARVGIYRAENGLPQVARVPADAVTSSASGLDPHISVGNARLQAGRVAKARGLSEEAVLRKIAAHTDGRSLMILGEPRVNVLLLNLDLDGKI
jgi:K+-transporting ATPase ATPase C chain